MKTKALRLYGVDDVRLEEFELPAIKDDEILVKVISDSVCMSTYKTVKQGKNHKRVPNDVFENPIILGHEFAGVIVEVGKKWQDEFKPGEKFAQQPALNYKGSLASPGYSYKFFGGDATYCIIPHEVMELGCLLHYQGDAFFQASLGEPMSCVIGGYHAAYHTNKHDYIHAMGTKTDGNILIIGGLGPMGLGAINYALVTKNKPKLVVVTDINDERIARAKKILPVAEFAKKGIKLVYFNPTEYADSTSALRDLSDGHGYDDVMVYTPIKALCEQADALLAFDGCLNIFAGPTDKNFSANINLYNCHYTSTHIMGTTGGNTDDLIEAIDLAGKGLINPALMVTHVGGLDSAGETTKNLPNIPGGKKLIYTHINMPLTAITDFKKLAQDNPLFAKLAEVCDKYHGLWNSEAEKILLDYYKVETN